MSTTPALKSAASHIARTIPTRHPPAVVVSAGRMQKTVKVRMVQQTWNAKLRKYFGVPTTALVHDPTEAVRAGDIIRMVASRHSKHVKHIVAEIVSPFGETLEERGAEPLSEEERLRQREEKRRRKVERRAGRGVPSAVLEALNNGWAVADEFKHVSSRARRGVPLPSGHAASKVGGEARTSRQTLVKLVDKGTRNEENVDETATKATEEISRLDLQEESGRKVDHV